MGGFLGVHHIVHLDMMGEGFPVNGDGMEFTEKLLEEVVENGSMS
ncbi:unnamed protein product [marine sediment metagenome]|uniref:Uncharacterized protein n=1 Tax=marine sediment metagenome TaxID=412755 RepID=X1LTT1_9ZZZZ